jgi:hypothetical protein
MRARAIYFLMAGALAFSMACTPAEPPAEEAAVDPCEGLNTLTAAERAEGWRLLFDGKTMDGWHGFNGGSTAAWSIEDCSLHSAGTESNYGSDERVDLATDDEFTNFELSVDWKGSKAGNSGIIYGAIEDPKYKTAWQTGPEYQLLDDVGWPNPEELHDTQYTGANYDMQVPSADKKLNPVGEWNTSKLVVNGPEVEHWLNGGKILEFERWTEEWEKRRDNSKWKEYPDYGLAKTGHIVLQDHGSAFWFRNIKVREIGEDTGEEEEMGEEAPSEAEE